MRLNTPPELYRYETTHFFSNATPFFLNGNRCNSCCWRKPPPQNNGRHFRSQLCTPSSGAACFLHTVAYPLLRPPATGQFRWSHNFPYIIPGTWYGLIFYCCKNDPIRFPRSFCFCDKPIYLDLSLPWS